MPEVQSDIKVLVTPVVNTTDLSTLRKQVEDALKTPINIKINTGDIAASAGKQAERAAKATKSAFSKVQVTPGKTFFKEFSDQFTKQTPEIKRLGAYYGQLQKQAERAAKAAESANKAALHRGQTALAGWDTKAEGQNVQRLKQYNDELQRAYDNAKALVEQGQPNAADTKGWEALADAIEKYRVELSKALSIQGANNAVAQNKKNYEDVQRQAESYFKKYETNITRNLSLSTKWQNLLNNLRNPDIDNTSVVEYREQLAKLINESQAAGVEIEKTGQKLSRLFGQHLNTAVAMAAIHALRRVLQQTYQNVIELDKALVDLQVSSGKSRSELKSLMMQYSEFAKSLGTTTIAVTQAADTWLRQGYDLSEVETLITDSIHLSVLGKIDSEEATKALTSTMKGYGIAVQDASTIVDKFTTVDMNAATSAGDLATAMAECAVSAKLAGIDIDRLTGYLAVVAETSQDGAESVGVFFKSMFARMGNIKAGRLVDPETGEDLSNVETVLNSLGIKLRNNEKDWRNFGDVLDDVAARWKSFSDTQRRAIANAFGQTRNQEKFLILMDQYPTAAKYADIAANSTGNAAKKYEAYMDGIEAHINQLTATFEKFSQTVLNSDMVKEGVDFLTNILNLLQQITAWSGNAGFGALTPLLGLGGGILGASGKGIAAAKTGILLNGTEGVIRTWYNKRDREDLTDYNLLLKEVEMGAQGADRRLNLLRGSMSNTAQAAVQAANGGVVALDKLNKGFNWAALGATALNAAINFGISVLLSAAVSLISDYIHRVERAHQATADVIAKYNDEQAAIESATKSLDENYNKLGELRQLQNSDKWSDELRDQYEQLKLQTVELERQLEIAKLQAGISQQDVADALRDEVSKTTSSLYVYNPLVGESTKHQAKGVFDYVAIAGSFLGLNDNGLLDYGTQEEYTQGAIDRIAELNKAYEQGGKLVDAQAKEYQALASFLSSIITQYQGWIDQAGDNPLLQPDVDAWKNVVNEIRKILSPDLVGFNPVLDLTGYVKGNVEHLQNGGPNKLYQDILGGIQGKSKFDILGDVDSQSYQWILKQAQEARVSVEAYVDALVKLGYVTDDITDSNDKFNASLLNTAKAANNDLEDAAAAFEALESAVNDYNDAGYITDETLDSLNSKIPGAVEALFNENGALKDNAAEALKSTSALITFIRAQLQAQLAAAQANYDNLKQELDDIQEKGLDAAAAMLGVQAAQDGLDAAKKNLADFEAWLKSGIFESGGKAGGGGGSKSIYSKEYEQITDLTEHYIKMSEMRQKRMNEESSEYKAESRQQFLYYQQLAEQTYAEISRLRAKGYTEANADFRKLLQNYESYLGSMYSIAKAIWEQEKQERIDAIQDQIDAENDRWEAREKQLNHEKDYYEALLELEQKYLDTIGDIHTEIRDLDKELAAAKVYPEGTNLDLFTDEEHDKLVAQLRDIEAEATELYTKYQEKLSSVSADNTYELSHITDEFQRQYEILLKQYEVSKADLAVARARRELENVLNERNVAMLVNGVWTWVADPESVKAAVEAVYEAEQTSEDALTDLFNTQRTQLLEETISNIELQRAAEEAMHDKIIDGLQDSLEQVQKMEFCFEEFIQTLLEGTDGIASAFASAIAKLSGAFGNGKAGGGKNKQIVVSAGSKRPTGLNDGDIIYYRDSGGSVNPILVGGPNPLPIGFAKGSLSKPAYTGTGNEWWNEVILKYGGKGWGPSFSTGGVVNFTGPAHLDGTQTDPEVVFNSADAAKLYHLVHTTPNLVDKLIGNVQTKFEAILPSGFKGGNNSSMTTDNSRKVYWNGNVLMEGHDADNFLTMLERVLPVV